MLDIKILNVIVYLSFLHNKKKISKVFKNNIKDSKMLPALYKLSLVSFKYFVSYIDIFFSYFILWFFFNLSLIGIRRDFVLSNSISTSYLLPVSCFFTVTSNSLNCYLLHCIDKHYSIFNLQDVITCSYQFFEKKTVNLTFSRKFNSFYTINFSSARYSYIIYIKLINSLYNKQYGFNSVHLKNLYAASLNSSILQFLNFFKKKTVLHSCTNYSLLLLRQYFSICGGLFNVIGYSDQRFIIKNFLFFEIFLKKFLENKICKKISINFNKYAVEFLLNNQYYTLLVKRIRKLQIFSKNFSLIREFVEILVISIYTCDVACLKNWLIKVAENMHFKLHKRFFYALKVIILKYFNLYFRYFGCLGICLKISGKIGLGGSSKTRSFWIKAGKFSLTKKSLKLCYTAGHIRTYSGVLGMNIILSYV